MLDALLISMLENLVKVTRNICVWYTWDSILQRMHDMVLGDILTVLFSTLRFWLTGPLFMMV